MRIERYTGSVGLEKGHIGERRVEHVTDGEVERVKRSQGFVVLQDRVDVLCARHVIGICGDEVQTDDSGFAESVGDGTGEQLWCLYELIYMADEWEVVG